MKKMLKAALAVALSLVLVTPAIDSMAQAEKRIDVSIETANGATGSMVVYDDYTVELKASKADFDLSNATIKGTVSDIEGIGLTGSKSFEKTGSLGMSFGKLYVSSLFSGLDGLEVNVDVCNAEGAQIKFVKANDTNNYGAKGTPNSSELVAKAWKEFLSHGSKVAASGNSFTFVKGSYFIVGGEKVVLNKGSLAVSDITNLTALVDAARGAGSFQTKLEGDDASVGQDEMRFVMKAGSVVSLAGYAVSLADDAIVDVQLRPYEAGTVMVENGILTRLKDAPSKDDAMDIVMEAAANVLMAIKSVNVDAEFDHTCKHNYKSVVTAPTCVDGGYTTYTCTKCGHSYKEDFTLATGIHTESDETAKACTCAGKEGTDYVTVCTVCGTQLSFRHEDKVYANKVEIDVVSGNATGKVTVNENYVVTATTGKGQIANADQVSVKVTMKDIAGLGIGAAGRTHTMNLALNTGKGDINLDYWFSKVFNNFGISKVEASVCDTNNFTYNVVKESADAWTVIATPVKASDVSAAWQKVLKDGHITPATTGDGDSRVIIKNGASIQVNNEVLVLDNGDVVVANANNLGALEAAIRKAATLKDAANFDGIIIKLPADSQVVMGSSLVTLEDEATITVEGFHLADGFLGELKSVTNMNDAFEALMAVAMDALKDEDATIKVDVDFAHGSGDQPGGDQPGGDQPGGDQPGGDQPGGDQPGGDQPGGDQPGGDQPGGDQPGGDQPGGDQPGGDQPGGDQPGGDQPGGDQPGGDQPGGDQPGGDQPGGDQPGTDKPGTDKPGTDKPEDDKKPTAPVTADTSAIALYLALAVVAAAVVVFERKRIAR